MAREPPKDTIRQLAELGMTKKAAAVKSDNPITTPITNNSSPDAPVVQGASYFGFVKA